MLSICMQLLQHLMCSWQQVLICLLWAHFPRVNTKHCCKDCWLSAGCAHQRLYQISLRHLVSGGTTSSTLQLVHLSFSCVLRSCESYHSLPCCLFSVALPSIAFLECFSQVESSLQNSSVVRQKHSSAERTDEYTLQWKTSLTVL